MAFRSFRLVVRSTPLPCKLAQALQHDWTGGRRLVAEVEVCLFGTERRGAANALSQTQPAIEVLNHPIAFTGGLFEAFAVQYLYRAAQILNHTGAFQGSRR